MAGRGGLEALEQLTPSELVVASCAQFSKAVASVSDEIKFLDRSGALAPNAGAVYFVDVKKVSHMNRTESSITEVSSPPQKRAYLCPVLTVFGPLAQLTQGGSGSKKEGAAMINPWRFP